MAIRVAINHKTEYRFDRPVGVSPHVVRLRPAPHTRTPIESYSLKVLPEKHFINWQQDPFGNYLARLVFPEPVESLCFEVDLVADIVVINPFDFFVEKYAEHYPFRYPPELKKQLAPYLEITEDGPRLREWLTGVDRSRQEGAPESALSVRIRKDRRRILLKREGLHVIHHDASAPCQPSDYLPGMYREQITSLEDGSGTSQQEISNLVPVVDLAQQFRLGLFLAR